MVAGAHRAIVPDVVMSILRDITDSALDPLDGDDSLLDLPGFGSIGLVQLLADIEDRFSVEFGDDDMELDALTTFGPLCALVERLRDGR